MTAIVGILRTLPDPDEQARGLVRQRTWETLRPQGALARLDEIAAWLAAWQRTVTPSVSNPSLIVFAGDHGVVSEGVSAYPPGVTTLMLQALQQGVATANVIAAEVGASMQVIDTGVGRPTGNIALEPAMTHDRFTSCFEQGREAVRDLDTDTDLLVAGEMGIGNTTAAAAVAASLFGLTADDWTGRGTGIDDVILDHKVEVVRRARERVGSSDPIETLR